MRAAKRLYRLCWWWGRREAADLGLCRDGWVVVVVRPAMHYSPVGFGLPLTCIPQAGLLAGISVRFYSAAQRVFVLVT